MAARGDVGVTIDVSRVPLRETGMTPYEILLSESQERMLVVAIKGREQEVRDIRASGTWPPRLIGEVIAEPVYRVTEARAWWRRSGLAPRHRRPLFYPEAREEVSCRRCATWTVHATPERAEERDRA